MHFNGDLARNFFAETGVGGDSAGDDDGFRLVLVVGLEEMAGEGFADGALETGGHVGFLRVGETSGELGGVHAEVAAGSGLESAESGGFEPREAEVERIFEAGDGEFVSLLVAGECSLGNTWAARVGKAHHFGDFIEGFAGGVVAGAANELVFERGLEDEEVGVVAGGGEAEEGEDAWFESGGFGDEGVGEGVGDDVIDRVEGFAVREGEGAGSESADKKAAEEAGAGGDGDAVDLVPGGAGFGEGFMDDGQDDLNVTAGGDLGHNPAVFFVNVDLAGDDVGADVTAVFDDGGCGFVAGGFDAEN